MKRAFVLLGMLIFAVSSAGQGLINFINYSVDGTVDGQVSRGDGTLAGPEMLGQLYAAPAGGSLQPIGVPVPFRANGIVSGGTVEVPFIPEGGLADVQLRSWLAYAGAFYEEAVVYQDALGWWVGPVVFGESNVITITLGGGLNPPASLTGLQPTQMFLVPEPSTCVLMALGLGMLTITRRR